MKRQPVPTQATIVRMIKAVRAAGVEVAEVIREPDGTVRVLAGQPRRGAPVNEWDAA